MAYVINKSDGTALTTLQDATIDTSTSVTLVGRNYIGYGEIQNENFLFLLENFANESAPARPVEGQVWFDKTLDVLKVYDGAKWVPVGAAELSATAPSNPPTGAFWLKTPYNTLYVWNGSDWQLIGPEVAEGYGVTKSVSGTLLSQDGVTYPVIFTYVNDKVVGITTSVGFTINTSNSVANFNVLRAGYNVAGDSFFQGNLIGVASRATQLDTLRTINGVGFNGTADITITANTTGSLKSGNYIDGNDFNGAGNETWNVDATPANVIGKVVARDSSGNFSAGTITADLSGNADTATLATTATQAVRLQTARTINGVSFNGTSNITITAEDPTKVNKSGSTMTGRLTLSADPIDSLHAATKQYVDSVGNVKAWVRFNNSGTIKGSRNVTSVTRLATGRYRINLTSGTMSDEWFAIAGITSDNDHGISLDGYGSVGNATTINSVTIRVWDQGGANDNSTNSIDTAVILVQ